MESNIILTTGVYDLIKDHIRRRRASSEQEEILLQQLKSAKQIRRRELSDEIVTVNKKVTIKDLDTNEEFEYNFVGPEKAKPTKNKHSILMDMGLAVVGNKVGDVIQWPFSDGDKKLEIIKVTDM